jgi:hypothetical protein
MNLPQIEPTPTTTDLPVVITSMSTGLHQHPRGFCLHIDGEEVVGAAPKRCFAGVAARFHLRLEGDKTNAVEWGGREKQQACSFVFLNDRRGVIFLNQTECDRKCERKGNVGTRKGSVHR